MSHCHTVIEELRQRGYRVTPQREMIIEVIAHAGCHMTAEKVFAQLQARTRALNIATVYRTLDLLVEEGLASRTDLGGERVIYATVQHGPHVHLVCRQCGQSIEADSCLIASLDKQVREQYGFSGDFQHVSVFGLCASCQTKPQVPEGG